MRALALALATLALVACNPTTRGDGFYRCTRSTRCPASAPICGADGFCHVADVDVGVLDGGMLDGEVPVDGACPASDAAVPVFTDCSAVGATCPGGQRCIAGEIAPDRAGYCAPRCTCDSDCPEYMGSPSVCGGDGFCRRGCPSSTDMTVCPYPLVCGRGRWSASTRALACDAFESFYPGEIVATCTSDTDCPPPLSCVSGQCMRPCAGLADCIDQLERCVASSSGDRACLFDCMGTPGVCGPGMTCTANGCTPPGW
jgi:hypothetical protein